VSTPSATAPVSQLSLEGQSLVDRVTHEVRRAIVEGRLRPEEQISIAELASNLGVSHIPVREALQRLAGQGLVRLRPARSAVVAPIDLADLSEIYHLRKLLETDAAARACPVLTDDNLKALEDHLAAIDRYRMDSEELWAHHDEFHRLLMRPVATPRMEQITTQLWQAAERYTRIVYMETPALEPHGAYKRHVPLLNAARSRSRRAMRKAMSEHLAANEKQLATTVGAILARGEHDSGS
jgi:DNA-binding GntR family transcriptional regulator